MNGVSYRNFCKLNRIVSICDNKVNIAIVSSILFRRKTIAKYTCRYFSIVYFLSVNRLRYTSSSSGMGLKTLTFARPIPAEVEVLSNEQIEDNEIFIAFIISISIQLEISICVTGARRGMTTATL